MEIAQNNFSIRPITATRDTINSLVDKRVSHFALPQTNFLPNFLDQLPLLAHMRSKDNMMKLSPTNYFLPLPIKLNVFSLPTHASSFLLILPTPPGIVLPILTKTTTPMLQDYASLCCVLPPSELLYCFSTNAFFGKSLGSVWVFAAVQFLHTWLSTRKQPPLRSAHVRQGAEDIFWFDLTPLYIHNTLVAECDLFGLNSTAHPQTLHK